MSVILLTTSCQKHVADEIIEGKNPFTITKRCTEELLFKVTRLNETKSDKIAPYTVIETIATVNDECGDPVFYVTNYKNGGFVIIAADNRIDPVLAFSETSKFEIKQDVNSGLAGWISSRKEQIKDIRNSNLK